MFSGIRRNPPESFLEIVFLTFIASFFLTLGTVFYFQILVRELLGGFLLLLFLFIFRRQIASSGLRSFVGLFFTLLVSFEILRSGWALSHFFLERGQEGSAALFLRYGLSPFGWSFYLLAFLLSFVFFRERSRIQHLLWLLSGCGFALAFNAIPSLLSGREGYLTESGESVFFFPILYFHPLVKKYILARNTIGNFIGDLIALGFFPSLSVLIYNWRRFFEERRREGGETKASFKPSSLILPGVFALATGVAVISPLSRGTMVSFFIALVLYLFLSLIKFSSRLQRILTLSSFVLIVGFVFLSVNIEEVREELQSLREERSSTALKGSFSANREGAHRALGIYRAYPLWGVGTAGYSAHADQFATPGTELYNPSSNTLEMAALFALCHYLQLMAEEGIGAYLYFLFVMAYFFEMGWGLWQAKSRFQYLAGLALFVPVLMILIHAAVGMLMQSFSISVLVYIFMGASLAVLRRDFQQA